MARIYGCSVHTTRIYVPYSQKHCEQCFFLYRPYIRVTGMHYPYMRPVCTGRMHGCQKCTCIYGP